MGGDFSGFRRGFFTKEGEKRNQSSTPDKKPGQLSIGDQQRVNMGLSPEGRPAEQASSSSSTALEATETQDGKGKQLDQRESKADKPSKQPERLSTAQLEALHDQFGQYTDTRLRQHAMSGLPDHVKTQIEFYNLKKVIEESLTRDLIPQDSAADYLKKIEMLTDKKLRDEELTKDEDRTIREISSIGAKLVSHTTSEELADETIDMMDFSSQGDLWKRAKELKAQGEARVKKFKDLT